MPGKGKQIIKKVSEEMQQAENTSYTAAFSCFYDRRVWILRIAYLEIIMQIVGVSLVQVDLDPFSNVACFHVFVGYGQFDFWRFAPWIRRHGRCLSL